MTQRYNVDATLAVRNGNVSDVPADGNTKYGNLRITLRENDGFNATYQSVGGYTTRGFHVIWVTANNTTITAAHYKEVQYSMTY